MAIFYLDVDDEITSAAQRIRATADRTVALVLPAGSRLATSRINFRLLAREAGERARSLVIVAPDASARALAASAGLPVYATVAEYEAESNAGAAGGASGTSGVSGGPATATGQPPAGSGRAAPGTGGAAAGSGAASIAGGAAAATAAAGAAGSHRNRGGTASGLPAGEATETRTVALPPPQARPGARSSAAAAGVLETVRAVRPRRWALWFAGLLLVAIVVAVAAAAWVLLPSASIVIVPKEESIGLDLTIKADPAVTAADPAAGIVPAQTSTFSLQVQGEFTATGIKVTETKATGTVTFSNYNTGGNASIPAGSLVSTSGGIEFATTSQLILGPAALVGINPVTVAPTTGDVGIQAVTPGTSGNVAAGAIKIVPSNQNPVLLRVKNAAATSGGTHSETKVVGQKDVDGAVAQLTKQLGDQFTSQLGDPTTVPAGLTLFPDTRSISPPTWGVDPKTLVGKAESTFQLAATATGSVTAVDQGQIKSLAESRVRTLVPSDHELVEGSITAQLGAGTVSGKAVTFPVSARATDVRKLDVTALREAIKGKPVGDARAYLDQFGQVQLDTWPGWTTSIPTYDFRLDVSVWPAHASAPASAPASPSPSQAAGSVGSPTSASGTP